MEATGDLRGPWNPQGLRATLKRFWLVRAVYGSLVRTQIWVKRRRQKMDIVSYLRAHEVRCLQIGAGPTSAPGWLRTDLEPRPRGSVFLDATVPFPIPDGSFDWIHSEHMIEHVPFEGGAAMLRECHRILKPGGRIRIATPDLGVLLGLYGQENVGVAKRLIDAVAQGVFKNAACAKPIFAINSAFRDWGHQFLYDEDTLREALLGAGFADVLRCKCGQSGFAPFRDMERHAQVSGDEEVTDFETVVLEALRPQLP